MVPDRFAPVLAELQPLTDRFAAAGHRLYLVGGTVRDLLVNRAGDANDYDATTDARPEEIKSLLAGWADAVWGVGEKFGTIGAKIHGHTVEITTYRADEYDGASRKPEVAFGTSLVYDLERRDFTVNALALRLPRLELVDPSGGVEDLIGRVLRTLSAFVRDDVAARREIESRQSWTVVAARVAAASPWLVLLLVASRPQGAHAFDSPAGVGVLLGGAIVTVVGYQLMVRIGRLPEEPRVLAGPAS